MPWSVEVAPQAARSLARLDRSTQRRVQTFLAERIATAEDPRRLGRPLSGALVGLWRYRIGDYRLICRIEDGRCLVLVLALGHRREVYR